MLERRKCARFVVPSAAVSYRTRSFLLRFLAPSDESCPVLDLSKGGISFLTDRPPWEGKEISLLLSRPDSEDPIVLEGKVVSVGVSPRTSYKYRVGVMFKPFEAKRGRNSLESLKKLDDLEKAYGPQPG